MTETTPAAPPPNFPIPIVFPVREPHEWPLPNPGTSFVGRERELQSVGDLLTGNRVRLVSLIGPGGVGKSRLALQIARAVRESFQDGIIFVDLAPGPKHASVEALISDVLGLRDVSGVSTMSRLVTALRDLHALLLLDGFEPHISQALLVAELLHQCEFLRILVTSREPLHLSTEWVREVPPLSLSFGSTNETSGKSEAATLFFERARAVTPDFTIDEQTSDDVALIVKALDGLPLAIELAAARLPHISTHALVQRLDHRMGLLTGGALDLPERHKTLRGAIDWSYDLLSAEEQRAFRQLSVFVNGFTLEAADHVIGPGDGNDTRTLNLLGALVSKSMVRCVTGRESELRYSMLDTLREFADEKLRAVGEERAARDKLAFWCLKLAENADAAIWGGRDHLIELDRLEAEFDNLRASLAWLDSTCQVAPFVRLVGSLGGLWHFRSNRIEGRRWLRRALKIDDGSDVAARAMVCVKLGMIQRELGSDDALELALEGLELRRQLDDQVSIGRSMLTVGVTLASISDVVGANAMFRQAELVATKERDTIGLANARTISGMVALGAGALDVAESQLADALELQRRNGFTYGEASSLYALGQVSVARSETTRAASLYLEALDCWLRVRNVEGLVDTLYAVADLAADCKRLDIAESLRAAASGAAAFVGYASPAASRLALIRDGELPRQGLDQAAKALAIHYDILTAHEAATVAANWLEALVDGASEKPTMQRNLLTARERDVLRLLAEGRSDREIAAELGLKYRTVTSYVRNILDKLNASSRTAAATRAVRDGLV